LIVTGSPGGPDNSLPVPPGHVGGGPIYPSGPVDPGYGYPLPPIINGGLPPHPDQGLPPGGAHPSHPIQPTYPVDPGYGLPVPPTVWPHPPRPPHVWPPAQPIYPSHPIYVPPGHHVGGGPMPGGRPDQGLPPAGGGSRPDQGLPPSPDQGLPMPPGSVWPPLPPAIPPGQLLVFCWIVGIGYRWTCIDTSLEIGGGPVYPPSAVPRPPHASTQPLPGGERPAQPIQPTPEPRR
jgi:hypothetical protein